MLEQFYNAVVVVFYLLQRHISNFRLYNARVSPVSKWGYLERPPPAMRHTVTSLEILLLQIFYPFITMVC